MRQVMGKSAENKSGKSSAHRLSVSLSSEQYAELVAIAHRNKVSVAWVVREAIERLLYDEQPLFHIRKPR